MNKVEVYKESRQLVETIKLTSDSLKRTRKYLFFFFRSLLSATCVFVSMGEVVDQEDVMVGVAVVEVAVVEVGVEGE